MQERPMRVATANGTESALVIPPFSDVCLLGLWLDRRHNALAGELFLNQLRPLFVRGQHQCDA